MFVLRQNDAHMFIRECVCSHMTGGQRPTESDIYGSALGSGNAQACKHVCTHTVYQRSLQRHSLQVGRADIHPVIS